MGARVLPPSLQALEQTRIYMQCLEHASLQFPMSAVAGRGTCGQGPCSVLSGWPSSSGSSGSRHQQWLRPHVLCASQLAQLDFARALS